MQKIGSIKRRFYSYQCLLTITLFLFIMSSCGEATSNLLFEQSRLNIPSQPPPGPIGLVTGDHPCTLQSCTPTATANNGTGNGGGNGTTGNTVPLPDRVFTSSANLSLFLTFSYQISNPATIAKYYTFVWGAQAYHVSGFRSGNPAIQLSYYISYYRDSGTYGNQDIAKQHSLSYWQSAHPDWILYQCDRKTPAYFDDQTIPFDITNPEVLNWQIQTYAIPASQNGFNSIAADNVNMANVKGACGFYRNGQWVARYTGQEDDAQWRNDILDWMGRMQNALHSLPHPLGLIPNLDLNPVAPNSDFAQQVASHVDGILNEGGFTNYGAGYVTDDLWLQTEQFIQSVQKQNKPYYVLNEVPSTDSQPMLWNIGSYLLCNEGHAALFISHSQQYGLDLRYPEYNLQIGSPTNEMYSSQGVYWRNFTGGIAIVNPSSSQSHQVTAPGGSFVDIYGNPIQQTFTLAPHSAIILLNS